MGSATEADPAVGRPLGESRRARVDEAGRDGGGSMNQTSAARVRHPLQECVLQVVAQPRAKGGRVGPQRQTMERRTGMFHARDFLAGSRRRALAAVTCPSSRAASCAATLRPCAVMR